MSHFLFSFAYGFGAATLVGAFCGIRRAIRAGMADE